MTERDFGIAVRDAVKIDKCYNELWQALAERQRVDGDEAHYFSHFSMSPHDEDVVYARNSRDLAVVIIREAASSGEFPVWIRTAQTDEIIDPSTMADVDNRTWSSGAYRAAIGALSNLQGRPLWVKTFDWSRFVQELMGRRYGMPAKSDHHSIAALPNADQRPAVWAEAKMKQAIAACGSTNRDIAWRMIFEPQRSQHGWDVAAFRSIWSEARGTKGRTGRPPKCAQ